jgi:predicted dehydrogenase
MMDRRESAPLRIGLVGTGIGRLHAMGINAMPASTSLAGVCALSLENAQRLADEFDVPFATDDYDALLERNDIEAVDLCVPHDLHMPMSVAAARAGKHILVEKPISICRSSSEAPE